VSMFIYVCIYIRMIRRSLHSHHPLLACRLLTLLTAGIHVSSSAYDIYT
jgi:hypothetical protein